MIPEVTPFGGESPQNYEQKCPCVLVLDVSGSMKGQPLDELQEGLRVFKESATSDFVASQRLEVSLVTFNDGVQVLQPFALLGGDAFPSLSASGTTKLVDGVRKALALVEERKAYYRTTGQNYYRPIVVLITDGQPDSDQDVSGLSDEIRNGVANRKFIFWTVGVKGYNPDVLARIAPQDAPPLALDGLKFKEFFRWLSSSISIVAKSREGDKVQLPPVSDWTQVTIG